jgi:hypothetical protein
MADCKASQVEMEGMAKKRQDVVVGLEGSSQARQNLNQQGGQKGDLVDTIW